MRRISASCLRFVLVVYVYVHSLQQIRTLLELLASLRLRRVALTSLRLVLLVSMHYDGLRAVSNLLTSPRLARIYALRRASRCIELRRACVLFWSCTSI